MCTLDLKFFRFTDNFNGKHCSPLHFPAVTVRREVRKEMRREMCRAVRRENGPGFISIFCKKKPHLKQCGF